MGRAYIVTKPPQNTKAKFGLLFIGNFKAYDTFRKTVLTKSQDGNFVYVEAGQKHFLTIENSKITDEEVRGYGDDNKGAACGSSDIEDRDLPGQSD